jgi:acetoin utilization protein AcuC
VILLACGADGLEGDPLSGLEYTQTGMAQAAMAVGEYAREMGIPVIIGGAGGYQPLDGTPTAWAIVAATVWAVRNGLDPSRLRDLASCA